VDTMKNKLHLPVYPVETMKWNKLHLPVYPVDTMKRNKPLAPVIKY